MCFACWLWSLGGVQPQIQEKLQLYLRVGQQAKNIVECEQSLCIKSEAALEGYSWEGKEPAGWVGGSGLITLQDEQTHFLTHPSLTERIGRCASFHAVVVKLFVMELHFIQC